LHQNGAFLVSVVDKRVKVWAELPRARKQNQKEQKHGLKQKRQQDAGRTQKKAQCYLGSLIHLE
jgi:hypothetical protein